MAMTVLKVEKPIVDVVTYIHTTTYKKDKLETFIHILDRFLA